MPTITNEKTISLAPNAADLPDSLPAHLLPTVLKPVQFSMDVTGVSTALMRALARSVQSGITVRVMELVSADTNNPFHLPEYIAGNIAMVPILQTTPLGTKIKLDVENTTAANKDVTTADLQTGLAKPITDSQIVLFDLPPNTFCKFEMTVIEGRGRDKGWFTVTSSIANVPIDVDMINTYERTGKSCSESDARDHRLQFITNGTIAPEKIVRLALESLKQRLISIQEVVYKVARHGTTYKLAVENEDDTTGNLLMKTITELYPDIAAAVYHVDIINRVLTLSLRDDNPNEVIIAAVKSAVETISEIQKQI